MTGNIPFSGTAQSCTEKTSAKMGLYFTIELVTPQGIVSMNAWCKKHPEFEAICWKLISAPGQAIHGQYTQNISGNTVFNNVEELIEGAGVPGAVAPLGQPTPQPQAVPQPLAALPTKPEVNPQQLGLACKLANELILNEEQLAEGFAVRKVNVVNFGENKETFKIAAKMYYKLMDEIRDEL